MRTLRVGAVILALLVLAVAGFVPDGYAQGAGQQRVNVCHIPPGNPSQARTLTLPAPAANAHLEHGDTLGACGSAVVSQPTHSPTQTVASGKPTQTGGSGNPAPTVATPGPSSGPVSGPEVTPPMPGSGNGAKRPPLEEQGAAESGDTAPPRGKAQGKDKPQVQGQATAQGGEGSTQRGQGQGKSSSAAKGQSAAKQKGKKQ